MSYDNGEVEKEAVLKHVAKSEFPAKNLAPYMGIINPQERVVNAGMEGVEWLQSTASRIKKGVSPEKDFNAMDIVQGYIKVMRQSMFNQSPSVNGLGRKQGVFIVAQSKGGGNLEPPKRKFTDKVLNRGKDKEMISGNG